MAADFSPGDSRSDPSAPARVAPGTDELGRASQAVGCTEMWQNSMGPPHRLLGAVPRLGIELGSLREEGLGDGSQLACDLGISGGVDQSKAPLGLFSKKGLVLHDTSPDLSGTMHRLLRCSIDLRHERAP
jgi:hypothetical protein